MRTDCALDADAVCAPCTPTPPGYLTTTPCGERTDTVWGACPPSMACYGGVARAQCPTPRLVRGGRCVCPNATEAASDGDPCLPFACPQVPFTLARFGSLCGYPFNPLQFKQGSYPDPATHGCAACTAPGDPAAETVAGVLGLGACACPVGSFLRPLDARTVRFAAALSGSPLGSSVCSVPL